MIVSSSFMRKVTNFYSYIGNQMKINWEITATVILSLCIACYAFVMLRKKQLCRWRDRESEDDEDLDEILGEEQSHDSFDFRVR